MKIKNVSKSKPNPKFIGTSCTGCIVLLKKYYFSKFARVSLIFFQKGGNKIFQNFKGGGGGQPIKTCFIAKIAIKSLLLVSWCTRRLLFELGDLHYYSHKCSISN